MGQVIVITSGKGGVGKTISTANIGVSLASMGKRVVLVDGDAGLRNLDMIMGLENRIVYTLTDVVENKCSLKQALIRDKKQDSLFLLPNTEMENNVDIKAEHMLELINELKKDFDYVLVDCPSGIEQGFENAVAGASSAIVVVTPEITSVRDADRVIGKLEEKGFYDVKIIINRFNNKMASSGEMLGVSEIVGNLNVEIIGIVEYDKAIISSVNKSGYFASNINLNSSKAFKEIGLRILGREISFKNNRYEYYGFGNLLKRLFFQKQSFDYYDN